MTVLPVYLVVDTSMSLAAAVDETNDAARSLVETLSQDPLLSDKVRVAIISFSDDARVEVPLTDPIDLIGHMPRLAAHGSTSYGAAFRLLKDVLSHDIVELKASGERVYRPVLFFVTDGSPTDLGWEEALGGLNDTRFAFRPTIIAFGFQSADPSILRQVAGERGQAFVLSAAVSAADAVSSIFHSIGGALASTIASSATGRPSQGIKLPTDWINLSSA